MGNYTHYMLAAWLAVAGGGAAGAQEAGDAGGPQFTPIPSIGSQQFTPVPSVDLPQFSNIPSPDTSAIGRISSPDVGALSHPNSAMGLDEAAGGGQENVQVPTQIVAFTTPAGPKLPAGGEGGGGGGGGNSGIQSQQSSFNISSTPISQPQVSQQLPLYTWGQSTTPISVAQPAYTWGISSTPQGGTSTPRGQSSTPQGISSTPQGGTSTPRGFTSTPGHR